jgi:hypothetical protein
MPKVGVLKLFLAIGGKSSKSYLLPEAPEQKQDPNATDNFYFAPVREKPKIKYEIDDRFGNLWWATLELFHRNSKTAIWKKELFDKDITHGEHEIEWDGKIDKGSDFPEEYITVEHSPYKLRMTLRVNEAYNYSPVAWTYLHVLVHSIGLDKGVKEVLIRPLDKDLLDTVSIPAEASLQKVKLISNIFATDVAELTDANSFTQYRDKWKSASEEGPNIPIFAKLFVKNSADGKEDVPKAIGRVRLLWDWRDSPEDLSMHFREAREYLTDTLDYDKNVTRPKGDNCHRDRGGKRGDDTKPVFPPRPGYAEAGALIPDRFPFKVERCAIRKWSSYSETWRTGNLVGKTGVLFQPSHIAGDAYLVDVYFAHNRKPDGKDDLDTTDDNQLQHAIKKSTGVFQIWREIHIKLYHKKHSSLPSLNFAPVAAELDKAYIALVDKSGAIKSPMDDYDDKIRKHLRVMTEERQLAVKTGDQGTLTKGGMMYLSYLDFKALLVRKKGWRRVAQLNAWLAANNMASNAGYRDALEAMADEVVWNTCNEYFLPGEGINVFHLEPYWETEDGGKSNTGGMAPVGFLANANRNRVGYIHGVLPAPPTVTEIATHEIGHTLFLPHAPGAANGPAAFHDDTAHWNNCMMSYQFNQPIKFCGLCLLRLRGWDHRVLNSNRTLNKR